MACGGPPIVVCQRGASVNRPWRLPALHAPYGEDGKRDRATRALTRNGRQSVGFGRSPDSHIRLIHLKNRLSRGGYALDNRTRIFLMSAVPGAYDELRRHFRRSVGDAA